MQVTNHDVDGRSCLGYSYAIPRATLSPVCRWRSDPMPPISPYIPRGDRDWRRLLQGCRPPFDSVVGGLRTVR